MKKLQILLLGRLLFVMTLVYSLSISTLGGVLEVGASANSSEPQIKDNEQTIKSAKNKTYNDIDRAWTYQGHWSKDKIKRAFGGQFHISNTIADYATISVEGMQFTLIYSTASNYGDLDVLVDDLKIYTINQSKSKTSYQEEWTSPELALGTHVLKFVHASGKSVNIDAIKVRGPKSYPGNQPTVAPTSTGTPSSIPSDISTATVLASPTNSTPLENSTQTPPAAVTSSPIPSSVPNLPELPTQTQVSSPIPSTVPSLLPSFTPVPTQTQVSTPTSSLVPSPIPSLTASPTSIPANTATLLPTPTATNPPAVPATSGKVFYVATTGNNTDGKSWATAWSGLNQVNWNVIQPGDTIYISGGATGAVYNGGIRISKSGTANGYITIDTGANSPSPAGHNGTVTIEGGDYCILATGSYLKVRNLLCQHATNSGFRIEGTGMVLDNNTVRETHGQGIHIHYCKSCVVRGNRITTFPNDGPNESRPYQTDGIVIYESSDTLVERNWVRLTNQYGPAHIDGIQASTKLGTIYENITIQYNYVENTKNYTSNSQGIYLTQMEGNVKIIGNVVNHPNGNQTVVSYLPNSVGSPANVFVVGNTIKCAGYRCLLVGDDNPVIKNNMIWQTGSNQLVDLRDNTNCNPANINNNLYYAPNSSYPFAGSCGRTWSEWSNGERLDANGIFGQNPNLDSCYRPTGTSPSIGKGAILADDYNQGLSPSLCGQNGPDAFLPVVLYNRNEYGGSSWDIGAYEFR